MPHRMRAALGTLTYSVHAAGALPPLAGQQVFLQPIIGLMIIHRFMHTASMVNHFLPCKVGNRVARSLGLSSTFPWEKYKHFHCVYCLLELVRRTMARNGVFGIPIRPWSSSDWASGLPCGRVYSDILVLRSAPSAARPHDALQKRCRPCLPSVRPDSGRQNQVPRLAPRPLMETSGSRFRRRGLLPLATTARPSLLRPRGLPDSSGQLRPQDEHHYLAAGIPFAVLLHRAWPQPGRLGALSAVDRIPKGTRARPPPADSVVPHSFASNA